jgi:hypothetical protein
MSDGKYLIKIKMTFITLFLIALEVSFNFYNSKVPFTNILSFFHYYFLNFWTCTQRFIPLNLYSSFQVTYF